MLTQVTVKWPPQIPPKFREQTFLGKIMDEDPFTLRLRTSSPLWPEAIIPLIYIVERNDETEAPQLERKIEETKIVYLTSSDAKSIYTVTFDGLRWTCDCKGFHFRASCKHLKIAEEMK